MKKANLEKANPEKANPEKANRERVNLERVNPEKVNLERVNLETENHRRHPLKKVNPVIHRRLRRVPETALHRRPRRALQRVLHHRRMAPRRGRRHPMVPLLKGDPVMPRHHLAGPRKAHRPRAVTREV